MLGKIRALVGDPDLEVDMVRSRPWYVNQQHATNYQVGRVLCGGDAVHRHPPSSGLGSNTCVQDGFNLAWKLAYVINGHAGPGLLDSYTLERAPVGQQIVARANQSRKDYAALRESFDHDTDDPVRDGLAKLKAATPEGAALRERLYEALQLKSSEFNAHGVELNQRYESAAVIPDPAAGEEQWARDRELLPAGHHPARGQAPARLAGRRRRQPGLHPGCRPARASSPLLTGLSGQAWKRAAQELDLPFLRTVVVGEPGTIDPYGYWRRCRRSTRPERFSSAPTATSPGGRAPRSGTTTEAPRQLQDALNAVLAQPVASSPAPTRTRPSNQPSPSPSPCHRPSPSPARPSPTSGGLR